MIILIVVSENPKILNVTSLQLTVFSCNCFNISSLEIMSDVFFTPQTVDSSKKPCSIPKWYDEIINEKENIRINNRMIKYSFLLKV